MEDGKEEPENCGYQSRDWRMQGRGRLPLGWIGLRPHRFGSGFHFSSVSYETRHFMRKLDYDTVLMIVSLTYTVTLLCASIIMVALT